LAGEAACNDVDSAGAIGSKSICCEFSHVIVDQGLRPVLPKHGLTERLRLAERDRLPANASCRERKAADARKQVKMSHARSSESARSEGNAPSASGQRTASIGFHTPKFS
jgi:hypothetical protein